MSSALFENLSDSELRNHHKLREAIRCRDEKLVQLLVQNGARVNGIHHGESKIFGYLTPLHLAVISRSPTIVKMLLDSGADSNSQILDDETPLTMAAKGHNTAIMDIFLSHNLRHSKNANGLSHLHVACMRNNIVAVKKLILMNQGNTVNDAVSQNSVCWAGYTALHFAVYFECMETIQILLNSGANILAKESKQLTPLHLANLCRNEEIIDLLLSAQRDEFQNPTDSEGLSHFHIACTRDNVSTVEHFLRLNVDIDLEVQSPSWKGWKPIHFAIYYECPNIVKLLLSKGTQLRAICSQKLLSCAFTLKNHIFTELSQVTTMQLDGNSADIRKNLDLLLAILQDKTEEMNKISFGNQAKSSWDSIVANNALWTGCTPLHLSLRYRIMDLAKALLVEGNNVMAQDAKGKTSLHIAFKLYCFFHKIFEPILGNLDNESLNFEVIDDENNFLAKTAQDRFWLKAYKGLRTFKETFHLITEHVQLFHQNLSDDEGLSVFHILCSTNYVELVETFIKNGVDVNAQVKSNSTSWGGYTALHFAVQFRQLKVIDTLLKYNSDISITNALGLNPFDLIIEQLESRVSIAYLKLFFDMTMKILSSNKFEGLNDRGVSLLHGLCVDPSTDLESLEKYLVAHPDELPKALNMPRSAWHKSTPLHLAMKFCSEEHVKLMLHHGADPSIKNAAGQTPIDCRLTDIIRTCTISDDPDSFLLGTPVEDLNPNHFRFACASGRINVVKFILDNITDKKLKESFVNCPDKNGRTILHTSLRPTLIHRDEMDYTEQILDLVLENDPDVNARDHEFQTPLHYAQYRGFADAILPTLYLPTLMKLGADVCARNIYGETPLHVFCDNMLGRNRPEVFSTDLIYCHIDLFLENGFDLNITDQIGRTCLTIVDSNQIDDEWAPKMTCILLEHMKKLQILGYFIDKKNERAYTNLSASSRVTALYDETSFVAKCEEELMLMMSTNIDRYATLRDILVKSSNDMTIYCENVILNKVVESDEFAEKYPIYGYLVKLQIKDGQIRRPLLSECKESLDIIFGRSIPHKCLEKILEPLYNVDLENIISSGRLSGTLDLIQPV